MKDDIALISVDQLQDAIESDLSDSEIKTTAQALLTAINDWPTASDTLLDFLKILINNIGYPLTAERIDGYLKILDPRVDAWKMEAISSVLEMFDYDETKSLDDIVFEISEFYKKY